MVVAGGGDNDLQQFVDFARAMSRGAVTTLLNVQLVVFLPQLPYLSPVPRLSISDDWCRLPRPCFKHARPAKPILPGFWGWEDPGMREESTSRQHARWAHRLTPGAFQCMVWPYHLTYSWLQLELR
jgi:hypothetical protein